MVDLLGWGVNRLEREAWDAVGSLTDVASRVMLSFGEFEFSIDTAAYNAMKRTMEWRWDEQQLIGKNDLLQYTGKGARTITLEGMAHAGFRDGVGMDALDTLVQMVDDNPAPHLLVSSTGDVMGYFVATAYSDNTTSFLPGGAPKNKTFTLELKYYGENWRTTDGDMLDDICQRHYGSAGLNQSLAAVLEANPGLADIGPVYPAGVEIVLPDWVYEPEEKETFQLWD